jgi:hypothetical protein
MPVRKSAIAKDRPIIVLTDSDGKRAATNKNSAPIKTYITKNGILMSIISTPRAKRNFQVYQTI